jgi:uncharacterized phage-like protein YoqJ
MEFSIRARSVCFTGHRYINRDLDVAELERAVTELINSGCDTFICGGALGFDTVAARLIIRLRERYPHIKLCLYLPCNNQDARWSSGDREEYREILEAADYVDMPPAPYYDGCMRERNYRMVDDSSVCICYLSADMKSGTAQTVRYANKMGLTVINVAKRTF